MFVIGPDKKIKLMIAYPMTTGRSFDEILRVIDSLQLTAQHRVATPVNWTFGQDVIIAGSVSDAEAIAASRALAAKEGIFCGISAGGACAVALRISREVSNATIVFIVCDRGDRYLSTGVFPA